jgi:hypothetical protein
MQRILLMVLLTSLTSAPARAEFNVIEASIADMQQAMASGKLTSRELVQFELVINFNREGEWVDVPPSVLALADEVIE